MGTYLRLLFLRLVNTKCNCFIMKERLSPSTPDNRLDMLSVCVCSLRLLLVAMDTQKQTQCYLFIRIFAFLVHKVLTNLLVRTSEMKVT